MISFDEAAALVEKLAKPLGQEAVALDQAQGLVLAEPVIAAIASPPARTSSMDGYAVRMTDLADLPKTLKIARNIFAGEADPGAIKQDECARIFTGAPVPDGADRIVIQEQVTREGDIATFTAPISDNTFIRAKGSDFPAGACLLEAGRILGFRELVAAAAGDCAAPVCYRQPKIALIATGDELARPGEARQKAGAIPDSVSVGVAGMVRDYGGLVVSSIRLGDDVSAAEQSAAQALNEADVVVVTGGASVGEKDLAQAMFARAGLEVIFAKVAMKPGKPVWLGRAGGKLVMGLPGNPTSALVTARLLLAPLVAGLCGRGPATAWQWRNVKPGASLTATGDREVFVRARLNEQGAAVAVASQDSGAQHALVDAALLLRRPAFAKPQKAGETIQALPF